METIVDALNDHLSTLHQVVFDEMKKDDAHEKRQNNDGYQDVGSWLQDSDTLLPKHEHYISSDDVKLWKKKEFIRDRAKLNKNKESFVTR